MKVVGIIAEYNPFHNGHAYQIRKAKELSSADLCIVAMSGSYVQRGVPAVTDKYSRASMALCNGADIVFEIPAIWATASAEYFAYAGITLLDALGCVDTVCFGCETVDLPLLHTVAEILVNEPDAFCTFLSHYLKKGYAFPKAREAALLSYIKASGMSMKDSPDLLLASPNNILALEYQKALLRRHSDITPLPIQRTDGGYHSTELTKDFSSASAIRHALLQTVPLSLDERQALLSAVPKASADHLFADDTTLLSEQDFSSMLYYKLLSESETGYTQYADVSTDFSNKITNALRYFTDFQGFCDLLKSKDITHTRISRQLLHILLNIRETDYEIGKKCDYIPYLRLLGFRKSASPLLSVIRKKSSLPILTSPAKDTKKLSPDALAIFQKDVFSSNLYYGMTAQKSGYPQKNEYQRQILTFF